MIEVIMKANSANSDFSFREVRWREENEGEDCAHMLPAAHRSRDSNKVEDPNTQSKATSP
jgi:hypothetical protein